MMCFWRKWGWAYWWLLVARRCWLAGSVMLMTNYGRLQLMDTAVSVYQQLLFYLPNSKGVRERERIHMTANASRWESIEIYVNIYCGYNIYIFFSTGNHDNAETLDSPSCLRADYLSDVRLTGSSIQVRIVALFLKI